jgi:hypothetical protein
MDGLFALCALTLVVSVPAMLAHELGRAGAALLLTRGRVCVLLGAGRPLFSVRLGRLLVGATGRWWSGGECLHAPTASRRRTTAIMFAGPLIADACCILATLGALAWPGAEFSHPIAQLALWIFACVALVRGSADVLAAGQARSTLFGR